MKKPNIEALESLAEAAIESGDPADAQRFAEATGMAPDMFQSKLQQLGQLMVFEAVQNHLAWQKDAVLPTLHEFREARRFVTEPFALTGDERDIGQRAFAYPGGLYLRLNMREGICSIDIQQKNWNGQDSQYELDWGVKAEDYEGYTSRLGSAEVLPGAIVCGPAQEGRYTLATCYRPFETGRKALEAILYERVYLRDCVPASSAEKALREVYDSLKERDALESGSGDFMEMVEQFSADPIYASHHLARHLLYLSDIALGIEEGAAVAPARTADSGSPSPGL